MTDFSKDPLIPDECRHERPRWLGVTWPTTFRALRHRNFRLFWTGQMVSLIGTWMQNAAQAWLVLTLATAEYGEAQSAFYLGLVGALGSLPVFFFSLFAGVFADRHDRRRILLITQTSLMLLALGLALLVDFGMALLWQVAAFAALSGLVFAFDLPARQSFIKDLATPQDLLNAIALNSTVFHFARIIGPAVAGWLIELPRIGIPGALYINAASFLAVIVGLMMIRTPPTESIAGRGSVWQQIGEGVRYAASHRVIRLLLILMAVYSVFGFSYMVLLPVIASQVLGQDAAGYGSLVAATGFGAFIGAMVLATVAGRVRQGRLLLVGGTVLSVALIAFSLSRNFWLSLAILPFTGGGLVVCSSTINGLIQGIVPDTLRGRVVSLWGFIFAGFTPIGSIFSGTVATATSPSIAVLLGGLACLVTMVLATVYGRWLWQLE